MSKVTLQDIAGVCDVDISTVSRALRNDSRVTNASRDRIHDAAKRLGYRPNLLARNLAGGSTKTLWFILPSLDALVDYRLVRHASHYANTRDYALFAAMHDCDTFTPPLSKSLTHYSELVERAGQGLADGTIILPRRFYSDLPLLKDLVLHNFPLVFIDNYVESLPVPVVTTDNHAAAHELAKRCVQAGAREAILLFEEQNSVAKARLTGAQTALRELGVPFVNLKQVPADWTPEKLGSSVAILGSAQHYLHHIIVRYAEHLSGKHLIFGVFDDWQGEPSPATCVIIAVQDYETMTQRAVNNLIAQIEKKTQESPRMDLIPVREFKTLCSSFYPSAVRSTIPCH
jgi:DNA-binding LacI/PurR family transcriptional regulator